MEAVQASASASEDPLLLRVPPVCANTDTMFQSTSSKNRTKLATIIIGFGVQEGTKEKSDRASSDDLKRFLDREGFSKDIRHQKSCDNIC